MSSSRTWLSALAPPHASARPAIVAATSPSPGAPPAPTNIPPRPVIRSSDMIRGFVSVT
jgi:hypothetical protein